MDELLLSILLSIFFISHALVTRYTIMKNETWLFSLLYTVTFIVPPMSHAWHILYGEDRIQCEASKVNESFGWTPCFEPTWNTFVNTYEITLAIENLFFSILSFYIIWRLFNANLGRNLLVLILNMALLTTATILLFASPSFLDGYVAFYDWSGFVVSVLLWLLIEVYVRVPYFGYKTI